MSHFCDSSALTKIYIEETGSSFMRSLRRRAAISEIVVAYIAGPEVISAIHRRFRKGDLSSEIFFQACADFEKDFEKIFTRVSISNPVISLAMKLIHKYPLRGYDSVQLASIIHFQNALKSMNGYEINFVCSDKTLIEAARNEGLTVIDPAEQE